LKNLTTKGTKVHKGNLKTQNKDLRDASCPQK
jgi:hypothetical protein